MGTLNYTLGRYAPSRGQAPSVISTKAVTSDAFSTSTSAANVEDGAGDITATSGQIFRCHASTAMWIAFGGATATVGSDFYIPADVTMEFEVHKSGTISVIDVP